jgi:hypothetical protein
MHYRLIATMLNSVLVACPALAQETPAPAPAPVREKKICRSQETVGTLLTKTVCHTKTEWADIDARNQRSADDTMSNRGARPPGGF